jgi:hypothetical protein
MSYDTNYMRYLRASTLMTHQIKIKDVKSGLRIAVMFTFRLTSANLQITRVLKSVRLRIMQHNMSNGINDQSLSI